MLDPEKAKWLSTCQQKIDSHHAQAERFASWHSTLQMTSGDLMLNHDDVMFFFPEH